MAIRNLQFILSGKDKSASSALEKVGRKADGLSSKFSGFGKAAALGVAGGVAGAAAGLAAFGKSSIEAYKEAEKSAADLAFAFEKFPALADSNVAAFKKLNEQLAQKTVFDDDATASGQAVLAQFGLTGDQILKLTPLLQDYAAKTGQDLPSAASLLGKAMMGNAKALKAVGITLPAATDATKLLAKEQDKAVRTEDKLAAARDNLAMVVATLSGKEKKSAADVERLRQARKKVADAEKDHKVQLEAVTEATKAAGKPTDRFTQLTAELNKQVGGFAEKQGKTAAGQAEILGNKFGELKETVGAQLLPVVTTFVEYLSDKVVPKLQSLADGFAAGTGPGGQLRDALTGLRDIAADLWPHAQKVAEKVAQFVGFLADHPDVVKTAAAGLALYWVAMKAAATWTGVMAGINLVKLAVGIGGVGAASATAAPGVAAVGTAAGLAVTPVTAFAGAITALVAAYVAYKAVAPAIADLTKNPNGSGGTPEFQPLDPEMPGGAANKPGKPPLIPGLVPGRGLPVYKAPAGSADFPSKPAPTKPPTGTRPENRIAVATIDGKKLSSATASAQQGRVSRGLVYASP